MAIEASVLWQEVRRIAAEGVKPISFRWELTIHVKGKDIKPYYVESVDLTRNYVKNHADVWIVRFALGPGTYNKDILPNKSILEATLRKIPLEEGVNTPDKESDIQTVRFRAIPIDTKSSQVEGNSVVADNTESADIGTIDSISFQLIDPVVERLRMVSVGGIYRSSKPGDLLRSILGHHSKKYSKDGNLGCLGVDIAEGDNPDVRDHYIIPHSTPLFNVPMYVHETCGGVYSGGFAFYYQDRMWYVFPPYDITRYDRSTASATIINIPKDRLPESDRTYRKTPTQVIIIATGETAHIDLSDHRQLNQGNGVRFVDARNVLEGFLSVDGNKASVDRTKNMNEFVMNNRETGLNMIVESTNRITDNYRLEYSKLAFRNGAFIQVVWENSKESLLYPGMPIKYMYLENNVAHELYGILVGVDSMSSAATPGPAPKRHVTKTALTLFVNQKLTVGKEVLV